MAKVRITIQIDEATLASVDQDAARLSKSRSELLRHTVESRYPNRGPVSEAERLRMIKIVKEMMSRPPTRTQADADRELRELRESRRRGWRRPSDNR
jgi:metal-responsive CopG/Arc/MetJ family transcriptional regulator